MTNPLLENYYSFHFKHVAGNKDTTRLFEGFAGWYGALLPVDKSTPILDFGCGSGEFLFWLHTLGYHNAEGAECSTELRSVGLQKYGYPIHAMEDPLTFLHEVKGRYSYITMLDILEHLPSDEIIAILRETRNALSNKGTLIVSVPQADGLTSLYLRYADFTHQTLFTEASLKFALQIAGFQEISMVTPIEKIRLSLQSLMFRMARQFWHSILKLIYLLERPGEIRPRHFWDRIVAVSANNEDRS